MERVEEWYKIAVITSYRFYRLILDYFGQPEEEFFFDRYIIVQKNSSNKFYISISVVFIL